MDEYVPLDIGNNLIRGMQFKMQREREPLNRLLMQNQIESGQLQNQAQRQSMSREEFKENLTVGGLIGQSVMNAKTPKEAEQLYNAAVQNLSQAGYDMSDAEPFSLDLIPKLGQVYQMAKGAGLLNRGGTAMQEFEAKAAAAGLKPGTPEYERAAKADLGLVKKAGVESAPQIVDIGGVPHIFDKNQQKMVPVEIGGEEVTTETVAGSQSKIKAGEAAGSAQGKGEETRAQDLISRGISAAESTTTIRRAINLLDSVDTGGFEAAKLRAKQAFGIESGDEGELSNSLGKAVLSQLRETFGAAFTQEEGARLERIEANFSKSPETNKRLLNQALRMAEKTANRAINAAEKRGDTASIEDIKDLLDFNLDLQDSGASIEDLVNKYAD